MLVDTHCHLYLPEFRDDIELILAKANQADVKSFYLPAIDSSTHSDMLALEHRFPAQCFAMMGLHPTSVEENFEEELKVVEGYLKQRKFAAVGEIGIDLYWDDRLKGQQREVFEQQIEWALLHELPIVIHSRNAIDECVEIVKARQNGQLRGVFHCFSGSFEQASAIVDCGFYLGIGGVITYKNSGLAEVISKIQLNKILLETDAPYLSPVPFRGKRNESSYLKYVVQKLAEVKQTTKEEIARITTANAHELFGVNW